MWASQKNLPARGVKFYFITSRNVPKEEHALWSAALSRSSPLHKWFRSLDFECVDDPTLSTRYKACSLAKVFCLDAKISISPSEAESFYQGAFAEFSEWFTQFCHDRKIECEPYDFRVLFRLYPPERHGEFASIPPLGDIARRVVPPPAALRDPPVTLADMRDLVRKTIPDQRLEELLKYAEKNKCRVYGDYGVRGEGQAQACQFYTEVPSPSEEIQTMLSLPGALSYELVLLPKQETPPDFDTAVNALLERLQQHGVIDNDKVQDVSSNPDRYFEPGQLRSRFVLKFDIKEFQLAHESHKALDLVRKQLQKELSDREYHLYGAISYTLTDEDLERIEEVLDNIVYFRRAGRNALYARLTTLLAARDHGRIIEVAKETDQLLISQRIIDLNAWAAAVVDIEDAKKRWEAAASDLIREGKEMSGYVLLREISGVPLQVFLDARESLYEELNKIAEWVHVASTVTTDNVPWSRHGCYVAGTRR